MITLTLSPKAEAILCAKAAREKANLESAATDLLEKALEWYQRDYEETCEGIRRGLEDFEAGRFKTHEEVFANMRERALKAQS